jgi:hypothetical protein
MPNRQMNVYSYCKFLWFSYVERCTQTTTFRSRSVRKMLDPSTRALSLCPWSSYHTVSRIVLQMRRSSLFWTLLTSNHFSSTRRPQCPYVANGLTFSSARRTTGKLERTLPPLHTASSCHWDHRGQRSRARLLRRDWPDVNNATLNPSRERESGEDTYLI